MHSVAPSNHSSFLSPVQKVTLLISAIVCVALIAIGAVFHQKIPGIALYATGAAGACATFLSVIILSCKTSSSRFASEDAAPGLPIDDREPLSLPSSTSKTIEEILQEAFDYIDGLSLPEEELWNEKGMLSYGKKILKEDFKSIANANTSLEARKNHLIKMKEALPFHLLQSYDEISPFPKIGIPNYGDTCYINVALQALAHTRVNDYLLLRPFSPPPITSINYNRWKTVLASWPQQQKQLYSLIKKLRQGVSPKKAEIKSLMKILFSRKLGKSGKESDLIVCLGKIGPTYAPIFVNCRPSNTLVNEQNLDDLSSASVIDLVSTKHCFIAIKLGKDRYQIIDDDQVLSTIYSLNDLLKTYGNCDFCCLMPSMKRAK